MEQRIPRSTWLVSGIVVLALTAILIGPALDLLPAPPVNQPATAPETVALPVLTQDGEFARNHLGKEICVTGYCYGTPGVPERYDLLDRPSLENPAAVQIEIAAKPELRLPSDGRQVTIIGRWDPEKKVLRVTQWR